MQEICGRTLVSFFLHLCRYPVKEVGHVGKNFDHKDLGYRPLRLCPECMSPVNMEKNRDYMRNYFTAQNDGSD